MPEFISDTEWLELRLREPRSSPLSFLLDITEQWLDAMEAIGLEHYDQALRNIPQIELLSAGDLAEIIVIALQFWQYGSRLSEELTFLERQLVRENMTMKMSKLSQIAQEQGEQHFYNQ